MKNFYIDRIEDSYLMEYDTQTKDCVVHRAFSRPIFIWDGKHFVRAGDLLADVKKARPPIGYKDWTTFIRAAVALLAQKHGIDLSVDDILEQQ